MSCFPPDQTIFAQRIFADRFTLSLKTEAVKIRQAPDRRAISLRIFISTQCLRCLRPLSTPEFSDTWIINACDQSRREYSRGAKVQR